MTIGEFGFEDLFASADPDKFPVITWFIFVIFLIIMTIFLMNNAGKCDHTFMLRIIIYSFVFEQRLRSSRLDY